MELWFCGRDFGGRGLICVAFPQIAACARWSAIGALLAIACGVFTPGAWAAAAPPAINNEPLAQLAARKFTQLTACELTVLHDASSGADLSCAPPAPNGAEAGQSGKLEDSAEGAQWNADREVRAALLQWLFLDGQARQYLYPSGVRIRAARIPDLVDLHNFTIPVELSISHSYLPRGLDLRSAKIPELNLFNSTSGKLRFGSLTVNHDMTLYDDEITPEVDLARAQIGGQLSFTGSQVMAGGLAAFDTVDAVGISVRNSADFDSFTTDGTINLINAEIGADLALGVTFSGAASNGLAARGATVKGSLWWTGINPGPHTVLDLTDARVGSLIDDSASWPQPGNLYLGGFVYGRLDCPSDSSDQGACVLDAESRLKWLGLQNPSQYDPQPYQQLASVLKARGDLNGARQVLIENQNMEMRFGDLSLAQRLWGWLLWATIDYGYESYWALLWAAILVMIGGVMVRMGHEAGVMKPVEPERKRAAPLVYSLDVFMPIVDLRLQRNWWPDPTASGTASLFGRKVTMRGSMLRAYLWFHIVAGYMLTGLFVAGLSGLVHKS